MSVGLIIDIVIGAALLISIIIGAVRGLFKTVIALVITVAAIIGSVWLSGLLVKPATDIVYPSVSDKLEKLVTEPSLHINLGAIISNATEKKINDFLDLEIPDDYFSSGLPEEILKIANEFGFDEENLRGPAEKALKTAQDILRKYMESQTAGKGGEIQLTDAICRLMEREAVYAYDMEGERYDAGDKFGFIRATIDFALERDEIRPKLAEYIKKLAETL